MKMKIPVVVLILALTVCAWAQSGGTFTITKSVTAGGGGQSTGGTFIVDGTIGQSLAGTNSTGGVFSVDSGFWADAAAPATLSGTVLYGNAIPAATRFVSNVTLTGTGSQNVSTTTGPPGATAGQYALSGFGSGAYTVTPSKIGGANGAISSFDAGRVALHVAGPPNPQLNATQLIVADVSGNGLVTSFDAGMIAKFVAGPPYIAPGIGATATWRFTPVNRAYASISSNIASEDYSALLMGEISGNWANTGARPDSGGTSMWQFGVDPVRGPTQPATSADDGQQQPVSNGKPEIVIDLPRVATGDKQIMVPVSVQGLNEKNIIAYEFDLRYDPSVIQPLANAVDTVGTISNGLKSAVNASEPGLLRVVMYGPMAISAKGILLNLKFARVGGKGAASSLVIERVMFNEGNWLVGTNDGRVELF